MIASSAFSLTIARPLASPSRTSPPRCVGAPPVPSCEQEALLEGEDPPPVVLHAGDRPAAPVGLVEHQLQRVVDINAFRALAPLPRAPFPGHHAPSPAHRSPAGAAGTAHISSGRADRARPAVRGMLGAHPAAVKRQMNRLSRNNSSWPRHDGGRRAPRGSDQGANPCRFSEGERSGSHR
jgi:hypothetical protein